jgi:hypothetical protein
MHGSEEAIKNLLALDDVPLLLMGIGYGDTSRPRRLHATDESYVFPTRVKQWNSGDFQNQKAAK